ncbi:MAG: helix-turn-helix transcriptional regulator [Bacteroidota bacterium]
MGKAAAGHLKRLGDNLRRIRIAKGLSLRQLSAICTIDYSDIAKMERGEVNIRIQTLIELAKALEVHPKKILDFEIDFND